MSKPVNQTEYVLVKYTQGKNHCQQGMRSKYVGIPNAKNVKGRRIFEMAENIFMLVMDENGEIVKHGVSTQESLRSKTKIWSPPPDEPNQRYELRRRLDNKWKMIKSPVAASDVIKHVTRGAVQRISKRLYDKLTK